MKIQINFLIILVIVTACAGKQKKTIQTQDEYHCTQIEWTSGKTIVYKCAESAQINTNQFFLSNDIRNSEKEGIYEQCIFKAELDEAFPVGWRWCWPKENIGLEKGYPHLGYGWRARYSRSANAYLPKQVGRIRNIKVEYDFTAEVHGRYNLAFDMWLTKQPGMGPTDEKNTVSQVMIWLDYDKQMLNDNWLVEKVLIDGEKYLFYKTKKMYNESVVHDYLVFLKIKPELRGKTNIHLFLKYLLDNKHIQYRDYINTINIGSVIWYGYGEVYLNKYNIYLE